MFLATELTQLSIPIIAPSPGPVGVWVRKPGTNKDDQVEVAERKNLALIGYRKSKTRQRCWPNQWISMRPLFFALVFTLNSSIFAFPLHFLSLFRGIFLNLSLGVHFARRMKSSPPLMMRVLRWENFENILWGICGPVRPIRLETCNAHRDIICVYIYISLATL